MKLSNIFKLILISSILFGILIFGSCRSTAPEEAVPIYPMFVDNNANNINDYAEQATHDSGPVEASSKNSGDEDYNPDGEPGHAFTDTDSDGICDYWDQAHPMHSRHEGMRFHDESFMIKTV
jgi:hypothetical protein